MKKSSPSPKSKSSFLAFRFFAPPSCTDLPWKKPPSAKSSSLLVGSFLVPEFYLLTAAGASDFFVSSLEIPDATFCMPEKSNTSVSSTNVLFFLAGCSTAGALTSAAVSFFSGAAGGPSFFMVIILDLTSGAGAVVAPDD